MIDWILRFVKGIFIGSGFILPGVSGGALAAVFGVYEKIISFLAHVTKDFKKNFMFLLPIGLGGIFGVFIFSLLLSIFLDQYETYMMWAFIGCILGTLPTLWEQAGKEGRKTKHIWMAIISCVLSFAFLLFVNTLQQGNFPQNTFTWMLAGGLIALGVILPGLSPSNFLLIMGMYLPMTLAIKNLEFSVIIPIGIGGLLCLLLFSKVMEIAFKNYYAILFHIIFGVVISSTLMIVPQGVSYSVQDIIICIVMTILGTALGRWMCNLEKKYKPED